MQRFVREEAQYDYKHAARSPAFNYLRLALKADCDKCDPRLQLKPTNTLAYVQTPYTVAGMQSGCIPAILDIKSA